MKMNEIVSLDNIKIENITKFMLFHGAEPFATSTQIAKYFGVNHKNLLQKIRSFHSYDELISRLKIQPRKRSTRGKEYSYYELDADAFTFTCMSFTGKKAESFKWAFIQAFKVATAEAITARVSAETNLALDNYFSLRQDNKKIHHNFTDAVKTLCDYAEREKGSSYSGKCPYYKHMQGLVYKALGLKIPKGYKSFKDTCSPTILNDIEMAESYLAGEILSLVGFGIPYGSIYSLCKTKMMKLKDEEQEG